ncbi:MAG: arsenite S-adenosylmethyltransferase [Denitrovibrio sp.]|nr:MAG: arsenite S-adenosylmethyltransferase [Denitrovibrio sp.]
MKTGKRDAVRDYYGKIAAKVQEKESGGCCNTSGCCGDGNVTAEFYESSSLEGIPEDAVEASLGCANPLAFAGLRKGETVLDLGSGGGINVLMSAKQVGESGMVYGLDMTDEMLELAEKNRASVGAENVKFIKGFMEDMPLPDESVDVIISNCVINLSEEKEKVISEAFRVLKKGGRLAIADVISLKKLSHELMEMAVMWSNCLGGTLLKSEYEKILEDAGFYDVEVEPVQIYTKKIIEEYFLNVKNVQGSIDSAMLEDIDGAFAGAYIKAIKR